MKYRDFGAQITYNEQDEDFDGLVIGASADIAFKGRSVSELERHFKEVVDKHLTRCASKRQDPYRKFNGTIVVRVEPDLHRDVFLQSQIEKKSLNKWIEVLLLQKVSRKAR
ncbi:MAG: type II toxin-antitoxin system HicB family antitoxin [Povalibacter sp.]|jgi:predicted HicB family RNase H-like nuclease